MKLIEIQNLHKTYYLGEIEVPVLRGLTASIDQGEFIALVGASGSGKSTLMNILGFLDRPTAGQYFLEGSEVSGLSSDDRAHLRNEKIGFIFQNFNLLPRTSALDNVLMPLAYRTAPLPEINARERAVQLLSAVGLADRMDHEPSQLSGGQQQRVAIARSLINHPAILFADEPTGNLDSKTSEEILHMFRQLNENQKITIVLVTHDWGIAKQADRVIAIHDGVIVDRNGSA